MVKSFLCLIAPISQPGACAESSREKSACASRTEKVHRAEVQDVPLRRKKPCRGAEATQADGGKECNSEQTAFTKACLFVKMGSSMIFSCRRIALKVFLFQFIAFQSTYAAPSPIIRFPGDDTPRTDKEVALVSLLLVFSPITYSLGQPTVKCWVINCI